MTKDRTADPLTDAVPGAGSRPARPPEEWTSLDIAEWTRNRTGPSAEARRQFSDFAKGAD